MLQCCRFSECQRRTTAHTYQCGNNVRWPRRREEAKVSVFMTMRILSFDMTAKGLMKKSPQKTGEMLDALTLAGHISVCISFLLAFQGFQQTFSTESFSLI